MKLKNRLTLLLLGLIICSFVISSGVQAKEIDDGIFIESIEVPKYSDINDYNNFLQNLLVDKPFNFVTFSMLDNLGSFISFLGRSFENPELYSYGFLDENDYYYSIRIYHNKDEFTLENTPLIDAPENLEDMRCIDTDEFMCKISKNGISYFYINGELSIIRFLFGDVTFALVPSTIYGDRFTNYPMDQEATFLSNILSADSTKATFAISNLRLRILWGWVQPFVIAVVLVVSACILTVFLCKKRRIRMSNKIQHMEAVSEDEYSSNPLE